MPALQLDADDGGQLLIQSPAIIEWLEERYPTPPLLPSHRDARARVRALAAIVGCDIHPVNNRRILEALRHDFGADDAAVNRWCATWISEGFDAIEALPAGDATRGTSALVRRRRWLMFYLVAQVESARGFEVDLDRWPLIGAVDAACGEIEAFRRAPPAVQPDARWVMHRSPTLSPPPPARRDAMTTTPSPPEDAPIRSFVDCHVGVVSHLEELGRLPALLEPARQARHIAADMLEFFRAVIFEHHADEERSCSRRAGQRPQGRRARPAAPDHRAAHAGASASGGGLVRSGAVAEGGGQGSRRRIGRRRGGRTRGRLQVARALRGGGVPAAVAADPGRDSRHRAALGSSLHLRRACPRCWTNGASGSDRDGTAASGALS